MSSEYTQTHNGVIYKKMNDTQLLISNAYFEEKKRWDDKLKAIESNLKEHIQTMEECESRIKEKRNHISAINSKSAYNGIFSHILNIFKTANANEKKLIKETQELIMLKNSLKDLHKNKKHIIKKHEVCVKNYPKSERYELAIMGNNLFKARSL